MPRTLRRRAVKTERSVAPNDDFYSQLATLIHRNHLQRPSLGILLLRCRPDQKSTCSSVLLPAVTLLVPFHMEIASFRPSSAITLDSAINRFDIAIPFRPRGASTSCPSYRARPIDFTDTRGSVGRYRRPLSRIHCRAIDAQTRLRNALCHEPVIHALESSMIPVPPSRPSRFHSADRTRDGQSDDCRNLAATFSTDCGRVVIIIGKFTWDFDVEFSARQTVRDVNGLLFAVGLARENL